VIDQNRDRPSAFPLPSWFSPRTRALFRDPLVLCLALIIVTSLFFAVFPGFDVWFSSLFYLPGGGFPAATLPVSLLLRQLAGDVVGLVVIALVFVVLLKLALPWRRSLVEPRAVIFILGTLIVGPGIVVNWIFKNHWGRPRPVSVDIFSGSHPFVPAWHMSDACTANCSFVSGEASSAIWLLVLAVLLPPAWRPVAVRILLVLAVILSLNRIAGGGHFLSDVLLAWWFTLAVMALGWRWLYTRPLVAPERFEAALTNAGLAIRRLFGAGRRPPPPTA
jgi:membrane-associated PAP2 superfamily phosphatase